MCVRMCVCVHMHVCTGACVRASARVCMYVCVPHVCAPCVCVCMCVHHGCVHCACTRVHVCVCVLRQGGQWISALDLEAD